MRYGMSKKCASTPCIFGTPTTHQGGRFGMKCLLWRQLATSVTMSSSPFSAFLYTMAQSRKLPSFSFVTNSGQMWRAFQNGEKSRYWLSRTIPSIMTMSSWCRLHNHHKICKKFTTTFQPEIVYTSLRAPGPTASTVASKTLPCDFSGNRTPPFVFISGANRSTRIRSNRGTNRFISPACKIYHKQRINTRYLKKNIHSPKCHMVISTTGYYYHQTKTENITF